MTLESIATERIGAKPLLISINEAAAQGIERLRKPIWANPLDHVKLDIVGGKAGPWTHLYAPFNKECNGRDPVNVSCTQMDYDDRCFEPYTGPTHESEEYKANAALYEDAFRRG